VEPGKPAYFKIKEAFGESVFSEDGTLNREALGKLIFDDKEKRRILNHITHPIIHTEIKKQVIKYFFLGHNFVALELPLLFEIGSMINFMHKIICVSW
jgi:dephospho-CoA kinase